MQFSNVYVPLQPELDADNLQLRSNYRVDRAVEKKRHSLGVDTRRVRQFTRAERGEGRYMVVAITTKYAPDICILFSFVR